MAQHPRQLYHLAKDKAFLPLHSRKTRSGYNRCAGTRTAN